MFEHFLTPIGLGLLGFIEPCSLGADAVFLGYIRRLTGWRRVAEALTFTLSRGVFLGLIGAAAGALGEGVLILQRWYIMGLGVVFILIGLLVLTGRSPYLPHLPSLNSRHLERAHPVTLMLGVVFGFSAPVCATPLLAALVARSLPLGVLGGFMQMFVFGVAMSAPLIALAAWRGWHVGLSGLSRLRPYVPYLTGGMLLLIGVYGVVSGRRS